MSTLDRTFVYSSDTELNPFIHEISSIDLLIHEATTARTRVKSHSNLQDIVAYYDLNRIGKLVLVHMTDDEPYEEVLKEGTTHHREKITRGTDLQVIQV